MILAPDEEFLQYSGRIDFEDPKNPEFVFPCSSVHLHFFANGGPLRVRVTNKRDYWDNYLGYILDQEQGKIRLQDEPVPQTYTICEELQPGEHQLLLFKRQDSCHTFTLHGFEIGSGQRSVPDSECLSGCPGSSKQGGEINPGQGNFPDEKDEGVQSADVQILPCPPKSERRIEFYGDSVSAGEVSEAVDYMGKPDPEWHKGELSNSWYSYAWLTARKLHAEIHDIAQGGISLLDGIGWFGVPEYVGMESVYDKIQYNPALGVVKNWDFSRYCPQAVVIAVGQNDSNPYDFMREDYEGAQAVNWRERYGAFIQKLRSIYPEAEIVLATTILQHDPGWDRAIEEVCQTLDDLQVHHFLYEKNGAGTPGHIRIPEAERMAEELAAFLESVVRVW
ncbi:MAG: GDSL-type esterase/lipase family protein [Lachnospiraceae bacterium]|nr:GDSL-type esterase/lipase family protein [Lachnospiraceae bacterium]